MCVSKGKFGQSRTLARTHRHMTGLVADLTYGYKGPARKAAARALISLCGSIWYHVIIRTM